MPTNRRALRVQASPAGGVELPKFRYLDDAIRHLDDLQKEAREFDQLIRIQQQQLAYLKSPKPSTTASLVTTAFIGNRDRDRVNIGFKKVKAKTAQALDPNLTKIVVPGISKLRSQYALAENLYEKHRTLEAMQTQLSMQFPDRGGDRFNEAMAGIKALTEKVAGQLKEVLSFLTDIADKHVPKSFKQYMDAVSAQISEHVMFEDESLFLYVHVNEEGELVFSYYLMLQDASNGNGQITPHLYISVQWVVAAHGGVVEVQINHEYEAPSSLLKLGGVKVDSVAGAVKAISHLLSLEEFSNPRQ